MRFATLSWLDYRLCILWLTSFKILLLDRLYLVCEDSSVSDVSYKYVKACYLLWMIDKMLIKSSDEFNLLLIH